MRAASVSFLLALQVVSRLITFVLNTALARGLGPQWYALANVQFQLVSGSVLFLAKEGVRRACQRMYPGGGGSVLAHGMNLAWLAVPIAFVAALLVGGYAGRRDSTDSSEASLVPNDEYMHAVWTVCAAGVLEAAAEPGWVYAQANDLIGRRVIAEGVAVVVRAVATLWFALWLQLGARAFGYAQLLYAVAYVGLLHALLRAHTPLHLLRPRRALAGSDHGGKAATAATSAVWLPSAHLAITKQYCWQSAQKYVLTEGERLVLVRLSPLAQQGVFAKVTDLGSLVARLVLQPCEEAAFAHFSQAAAARALDLRVLQQLHALLRAAAIFGGLFLSFGPAYSWLLLHLLYGPKWSDTTAPTLLAAYCLHVCAMAINGIAEAFIYATASDEELKALSRATAALAALYLPAAVAGLHWLDSIGLVLTNWLNLLARIAYALAYIRRVRASVLARHHASDEGADAALRLLPHPAVLSALLIAAIVTGIAKLVLGAPHHGWHAHAGHVAVGAASLCAVGLVTVRAEPELLIALRTARRGGNAHKRES